MKKLKFLVGAVALFAIVVVNVWNAATVVKASGLDVADVEAMAQLPCETDWSTLFTDMFRQFDNHWIVKTEPCTGTTHIIIAGSYPLPPYYERTYTWHGTIGSCFDDGNQYCFPWDCTPNK